jgi:4-aminobutyrate aminotransferase-like enzyme
MLLLTGGVDDQVVRFIPPLVVGEGEIDEGLAVFGRAGAKATAAHAGGAVCAG